MFSWLRRPKVATSLESVDGPTLVHVSVAAAGGALVESPASGVRCLLVRWGFYYGKTQYDRKMGGQNTRYRLFRAGLIGKELQLSSANGSSIRLAVTTILRVKLRGDAADLLPISHRIASAFPEIVASSATSNGQLAYNEAFLLPGDRLLFKGVVTRIGEGQFQAVETSIAPELVELDVA
jgi:hypothetical protein